MATEHSNLDDTVELDPMSLRSHPPLVRVAVDSAAASHQGHVRPNNEDHFLVARFGRFLEPLSTNITKAPSSRDEGHAMVVADGMGGAAAGEVASELAIRALVDLVEQTPDWILSREAPEAERVMERMAERYRQIDTILSEEAEGNRRLAGMGTTMTLTLNVGNMLVLAHIGDSRAYLHRANRLHQLTRDHTRAQELVDLGIFRHEREASARLRHTLTRVLGGSGGDSAAEVRFLVLLDGDAVLLCSDGLTDMVNDEAIAATLDAADSSQKVVDSLIRQALANGGKDNVTVALARFRISA